jgi:hypothetical protein
MKNIKKIAEEIFKAPTVKELLERAEHQIPFMSSEKIQEAFKADEEQKTYRLFPNGAYYVTDHYTTSFKLVNNYFTDNVKHWTEIHWKRIRYSLDWHKGKLNGKTVVRASLRDNIPVAYYFEKGIF